MSSHFLNSSINYLHHHPRMGILFAFIVAFLESLPIIGTIIPGSITMTAVGAMIGAGLIPGYLTLAIASCGAFLGDIIGFLTGRIFKDKLKNVWPFRKHPKIISTCETFILKHGGKSILIGRFVGAVRSAVPMVAGLLQLSLLRFLIAALPTAILWAVVYSLPGIVLGAFSMEIPASKLTEYLVIGIIVIAALWFLFWATQRFFRNIYDFYHSKIDRYWDALESKRGSHFIINYLYNRQNPDCHFQLSRLIFCVFCLVVFVIFLLNLVFQTSLLHVNLPVFHLAQSLRIYNLDPFFVTLTLFGKPALVAFIAFVISFGLVFTGQWRAAAHLCIATIVTVAVVYGIKYSYFNPRPSGFMLVKATSSFPSGHTAVSTVVFSLLAFFTAQCFTRHKGIIYLIAGVLIVLIGVSRLYLGAHWLIDVVASFFLGMAITTATIINYQRLPKPSSVFSLNRWGWTVCMLIVVCASWAGNVYYSYDHIRYNATPFKKTVTIKLANWWQHPHIYTTRYRRNRFGHQIQPLNIQWAGSLSEIEKTLKAHHWQSISRQHHVKDTLQRLASNKPQYHLPVFALLFHNKRPAAVYFKTIPKQKSIYILRLWDSHIHFDNKQQLWIGMLNELNPPTSFVTFEHYHLMSFAKLHTIEELLGDSKKWITKSTQVEKKSLPKRVKGLHWDRKVWLIRTH